jgi:hypothetical protein
MRVIIQQRQGLGQHGGRPLGRGVIAQRQIGFSRHGRKF